MGNSEKKKKKKKNIHSFHPHSVSFKSTQEQYFVT